MFQFKQFTIQQDQCAMKVCTDSCLFGAWVADELCRENEIQSILDIGTGTGLLSLMLAQQCNASISAIEINESAAKQASENFAVSKWCNRLKILQVSLQLFLPLQKFDLIICNPPFFEKDLLSPSDEKNAAKHQGSLKLEELFDFCSKYLSSKGMAAILLPYHLAKKGMEIAEDFNLFCNNEMQVKQTTQHHYFRTMQIFSRGKTFFTQNEISIKDANGNYTIDFTNLLKGYYLKL